MSDATTAPDAEMTRAILAEADAQARKLVDDANAAVEADLAKARAESAALSADIRAKAAEKAAKLRARALAVANVEKRRMLLTARETAASKVFCEIDVAIAAIRNDTGQYKQSLALLLDDAVRGVGDDTVRVAFHERDKTLAEEFIAAPRTGKIIAEFTLPDSAGGCIAMSEDGHVTLNNTYTRRLERMNRAIRASIMREVAAKHE